MFSRRQRSAVSSKKCAQVPLVILRERLGNQLFQWATAFSLSMRHHVRPTLFTCNYGRSGKYLTLRHFPLSARFQNPLPGLLCRRILRKEIFEFQRFDTVFGDQRADGEVTVPNSMYRPAFQDLPEHTLLDGMFQSCLYFLSCRDSIQIELGVLTPKMQTCCPPELLRNITSHESVSMHIRRGDYLVPGNREVYDLCSVEYYREAMNWIRKSVSRPRFFVFSDDIGWAKENFHDEDVEFSSSTDARKTEITDFVLMANCRHHIICNSSFSWWASFAGRHGLVAIPDLWTRNGQVSFPDKLLPGWHSIPTPSPSSF
jgi:hypothetical protein